MALSLFPDDREPPPAACAAIRVHMERLALSRARQWGARRLALELREGLALGDFWRARRPASREGTRWLSVLKTLRTATSEAVYRLIDPGSAWRLHRAWFDRSAMAELLGEDFAIAQKDTLSRRLAKLLARKDDLFSHLRARGSLLFGARCEVLLYDLTSTYFESWPGCVSRATLAQRLKACAPGWTPRSALEQLAGMQMIDVKVPTADGRRLEMARHTQPDKTQQLVLAMLELRLPPQPPPKIHG